MTSSVSNWIFKFFVEIVMCLIMALLLTFCFYLVIISIPLIEMLLLIFLGIFGIVNVSSYNCWTSSFISEHIYNEFAFYILFVLTFVLVILTIGFDSFKDLMRVPYGIVMDYMKCKKLNDEEEKDIVEANNSRVKNKIDSFLQDENIHEKVDFEKGETGSSDLYESDDIIQDKYQK